MIKSGVANLFPSAVVAHANSVSTGRSVVRSCARYVYCQLAAPFSVVNTQSIWRLDSGSEPWWPASKRRTHAQERNDPHSF